MSIFVVSLVSHWFLNGSPFPKTGEEGLPLPGPWPNRKRWTLPNRCQTLVFARKRRDQGGGDRRLAMAMTADCYGWPWQMLMCVVTGEN